MSIIGIILGTIAIGLFIWLKKDQKMSNLLHKGDLEAAKHAYEALMSNFNNYQVNNERKVAELDKELKVLKNKTHQWNKVTNNRIDKINKNLPNKIKGVMGMIGEINNLG